MEKHRGDAVSPKSLMLVAVLGTLPLGGGVGPASAEAAPPPRRAVHPRINVNPRPLLYRECRAWYVLQHRPSGTVLFPQQHCWWVRG